MAGTLRACCAGADVDAPLGCPGLHRANGSGESIGCGRAASIGPDSGPASTRENLCDTCRLTA